jgi:tRNA dimethylallyltransferase
MDAANNHGETASPDASSNDARPRIVSIAGPTAVGKTALAIALAREFDGEVVNADSRYLYRGFDVGVAKPNAIERRGVPHHLIDVLPPHGEMSLARYQDLALAAIAGVVGRGRLPLLVGGTPLYLNAVLEGWRIPRVPPDPAFRAAREAEAAQRGIPALAERLRRVDPAAADRAGLNLRRIVRALEVYEATGVPMTEQEGKGPPPVVALEIGLTMPRERLYRAIDERVHAQIARGLVAEVRTLREGGVPDHAPAMSSIGYRQLLPYLRGETDLETAIRRIQYDTHRYVRHQLTWLRRNPRLVWFDVSQPAWQDAVRARLRAFLEERNNAQPADAPLSRPRPHRGRFGQEPVHADDDCLTHRGQSPSPCAQGEGLG